MLKLAAQNVMLKEQVHQMLEELQKLRDEIARLKKQNTKPKIGPSKLVGKKKGKNGYCTHIGNEWFAWFESTKSKSRINFLELLRAGNKDYVLSGEALEYMAAQKLPKEQLKKLAVKTDRFFSDKPLWKAFLKQQGITCKRHVRIATEGDIREYVKRRKISGGTRSEEGRRGRDTFASLKKTCRKLNVSFGEYVNDRVRSKNQTPQLPTLIAAHAQSQ